MSSRELFTTLDGILSRGNFSERGYILIPCVVCENPTEGFNILTKFDMKVSLEVFIKTAVEFLVLVPVHSKSKII